MATNARSDEVSTLVRVLEALRRLDPDMPIQYALSFLTVAQNEGLSIRELSERLGIAQSSASRNVAALSRWRGFDRPGHDLVQATEDPRERRRKVVTLTPRGRALVDELRALVSPPSPPPRPPPRSRERRPFRG
ncbi:MAG TPA: helix-turn-helix domain-containing protein [Arenibaculum sp.]|nr:helix-turn-helix domain-containing protein [Arenibaculum sp.]